MQSILSLPLASWPLRASWPHRARTRESFFLRIGRDGAEPGLATLVLSQVTTWIFARSLLNAAILGYLYGIAGAVAYAAYYGSFLTGALIADGIRSSSGAFGSSRAATCRIEAIEPAHAGAVSSFPLCACTVRTSAIISSPIASGWSSGVKCFARLILRKGAPRSREKRSAYLIFWN